MSVLSNIKNLTKNIENAVNGTIIENDEETMKAKHFSLRDALHTGK